MSENTTETNAAVVADAAAATVASTATANRLQCQHCNSTYSRPEHLKRHMRSHAKEKPFICKRCAKRFTRSDSLYRHAQLHASPPPTEADSTSAGQPPRETPDPQGTSSEPPPANASRSGSKSDKSSVVGEGPGNIPAAQPSISHGNNPAVGTQYPVIAQHAPLFQLAPHIGDPQGLDFMDLNWLPLMTSLPDSTFDLQHTWSSLPDFTRLPQEYRENDNGNNMNPGFRTPGYISLASPSAGTHVSNVSDNSGPLDASPVAEENTPSGEFYADGGGARLPRGTKRKRRPADSLASRAGMGQVVSIEPIYGFKPEEQNISDVSNQEWMLFPDVYAAIHNDFIETCCVEASLFPPYESGIFPSRTQLDRFMRLAVDEFLPSSPFIHNSLIGPKAQASWLLCLALASIGSRYEEAGPDIKTVLSLHEFLRRAIVKCVRSPSCFNDDIKRFTQHTQQEKWRTSIPEMELIQAKLLYCIGAYYTGDRRQARFKESMMGELTDFCRVSSASMEQDRTSPTIYEDWIMRESCIRVVYFIWLVDCMLSYQVDRKPCLDLSSAHAPLPCLDVLWEAPSEDSWRSKIELATSNPSLCAAIETLYLEKRVPQTVGELGRILLIHGLFHHTWLVSSQYTSTLNNWQPHSKSSIRDESLPLVPSKPWPPSVPAFARWRNAACDCLDILHWHANALIGLASGREHPTVFFLHLARIVLLAPIDSIRTLALAFSGIAVFTQTRLNEAREEIFRWAREDQYKARLAMIHAGVLQYHVRRHSTDAFYEPWGMFLSSLAIWAYGTVWAQSTGASAAATLATLPDGDDAALPAFIHLDRPCDDELVQLYILHGGSITAYLQGVGDICTLEGSRKVLKEGCKLLKELRSWDLGTECLSRLSLLWESLET